MRSYVVSVKPHLFIMSFLKNFKLLEFEELYLKGRLKPGLASLYTNRITQQAAAGLINLFLPIFLFVFFGNINIVLLFFIVSYVLAIFFIPLGAILMTKTGFKKSMIIGSLFSTCYFICLYLLSLGHFIALFFAIGFIVLSRMFYWVPYHTDFAKLTSKRTRGREIALLVSIASLISVAVPFVSGFIIARFGFHALFAIALGIDFVSTIPILFIKPINEKYSYSYFQTFKELFSKKNKNLFLAYMGDGAEAIVGVVIWPVFIFQLLKGEYFSVGIVSSLVVLASIIFRLIMGNVTDRFSKRKLIKIGSALYSVGWVVKVFIQTAFQIFVVNAYHSFVAIIRRNPFTTLMYEQAADRGHYVDEYTVLREVSLNIGRVLMLCLMLVLFSFASLSFAFVLAAFASLLIGLL